MSKNPHFLGCRLEHEGNRRQWWRHLYHDKNPTRATSFPVNNLMRIIIHSSVEWNQMVLYARKHLEDGDVLCINAKGIIRLFSVSIPHHPHDRRLSFTHFSVWIHSGACVLPRLSRDSDESCLWLAWPYLHRVRALDHLQFGSVHFYSEHVLEHNFTALPTTNFVVPWLYFYLFWFRDGVGRPNID